MDQINHNATMNDNAAEEIPVKQIIITIREWVVYLLRKWPFLLLAGLAGGALGLLVSFITPKKYTGTLTFVVEESKSSPLANYAGIASQFGIDVGLGSGNSVFAGDNIIEFLKSRLLVEKALLSPISANQPKVSIADHYLSVYDYKKNWKEIPELAKLNLPPGQARTTFNRLQDSVLKIMYEEILEKSLSVSKPDKKSSFIIVEVSSLSEQFSKLFSERLVSEATNFYIKTKTQNAQTNVDKLQEKADSIEKLLRIKTYSAASEVDLNQNPVKRVATVQGQLVTRDQIMLQTMYGEVIKNLELSRIAMNQETPVIQVVDFPILPLDMKRIGIIKGVVIGGFVLGFLALAFLIVRRYYQQIMK